jgi:hypothetical protein
MQGVAYGAVSQSASVIANRNRWCCHRCLTYADPNHAARPLSVEIQILDFRKPLRLIRCSGVMGATSRTRAYNQAEKATRPFPEDIGASGMLVNILGITDDAKCYEMSASSAGPRASDARIVIQPRSSSRAGIRPSRNGSATSASPVAVASMISPIRSSPGTTNRSGSGSWSCTLGA